MIMLISEASLLYSNHAAKLNADLIDVAVKGRHMFYIRTAVRALF